MAVIERHPKLEDYFVEMTLPEIAARGGVREIFEDGRLILIKDYRLDFDFGALAPLNKSIATVDDRALRKRLKKLTAPQFFEGKPPIRQKGRLIFDDPIRQAIYDVLCRGDSKVFNRAAAALNHAHHELLRLFDICFPGYDPYRLVASVRLTRTLFENLHWDNHSIDDDFHQARIFANLDVRPRLWNVGSSFPKWVRASYEDHDLGRFAGKDPNQMLAYVTGEVLGGTRNTWMDNEPKHRIAFDPGEIWLGESRLISHQIYYGEAAMVYMWFVKTGSMVNPSNRFNAQVEEIHRQMQTPPAQA